MTTHMPYCNAVHAQTNYVTYARVRKPVRVPFTVQSRTLLFSWLRYLRCKGLALAAQVAASRRWHIKEDGLAGLAVRSRYRTRCTYRPGPAHEAWPRAAPCCVTCVSCQLLAGRRACRSPFSVRSLLALTTVICYYRVPYCSTGRTLSPPPSCWPRGRGCRATNTSRHTRAVSTPFVNGFSRGSPQPHLTVTRPHTHCIKPQTSTSLGIIPQAVHQISRMRQ